MSMQAVIEQLKVNNRSEAGRDSRHTMMLNELKVQNQEGFQNLINTLSSKLQDVKNSVEDTTDTQPDDKGDKPLKSGDEEKVNRLLNFLIVDSIKSGFGEMIEAFKSIAAGPQKDDKGDKPLKSGDEEKENRMTRVFKKIAAGPQKIVDSIKKGFGGLVKSLKDKGAQAWDIAKKFLLFGALGALIKFLESDLWKDLKDKYLPSLMAGLKSIGKVLKDILDGFFIEKDGVYTFSALAGLSNIMSMVKDGFINWGVSLKDAFFDENGDFTLTGGIKNLAGDFATILLSLSAFAFLLSPRRFFGTLWQVGRFGAGLGLKALGGIGAKFGMLLVNLTGFGSELDMTNQGMSQKLAKSKKTGIFRKGLGGLLGRFGRLFRFFGTKFGIASLIIGAGAAMTSVLDSEKAKGIFSAGKNGLTFIFSGAFDVVKNFGSSFKNLVSAAGGKLRDVFKGAQTDVDGKKPDADKKPEGKNKAGKTRAEIEAEKKNKAKIDPELDKKQKENLKKMEADRLAKEKAQFEADKKRQDINRQLRNADAEMVKKDLEAQKKKKLALEAEKKAEAARLEKQRLEAEKKRLNLVDIDAKKLNKSLLKATARFTAKAVPIAGAFFGIFETGRRLIQGDFGGAAREAGGVFLPSVAGAPVDASLMATDIYKDMFGTTYEADLLKDASLANQRMKIIGSKITDYFKGTETAANASAISPMMEAGRGNIYNTYNNVDNSSQSSSQTHLNNGMSDSGAPAGSSVRPF